MNFEFGVQIWEEHKTVGRNRKGVRGLGFQPRKVAGAGPISHDGHHERNLKRSP